MRKILEKLGLAKKKEEAVAKVEPKENKLPSLTLEGKNDWGYVFVSREGQVGRAVLFPDGDINFYTMEDPDNRAELSKEDALVLFSQVLLGEKSEEVQTSATTLDISSISEDVPAEIEEMRDEDSLDIRPVSRQSLTTEETEKDMQYQGIDDKLVADLACAGVPVQKAQEVIEVSRKVVEGIDIEGIPEKDEVRLCDMLVSAIARNFSVDERVNPKVVFGFFDTYLEGRRKITMEDACKVAALSNIYPVMRASWDVIMEKNGNNLDTCRQMNREHLLNPCVKRLKQTAEYTRPDEGVSIYWNRLQVVAQEYLDAISGDAAELSPEAM